MKRVIFFAIVAVSVSLVVSREVPDKYKNAFKECNEDPALKLDEDIREKASKNEKIEYTPKIGAFCLCVSKKVGSISDAGDVNVDRVRTIFSKLTSDEAKLNESVQKCTEKKATPEETAFNLWSCSAAFMKENRPAA